MNVALSSSLALGLVLSYACCPEGFFFRGFPQCEGKFRDKRRLRHGAFLPRRASFIVPLPHHPSYGRDEINVTKINGIVLFIVCPDVSVEHAVSTCRRGIFICSVGTPVAFAVTSCSAQSFGQFVVSHSEGS